MLCRVLLSGEVPSPQMKPSRHHEDRSEKRDKVSLLKFFNSLPSKTLSGPHNFIFFVNRAIVNMVRTRNFSAKYCPAYSAGMRSPPEAALPK